MKIKNLLLAVICIITLSLKLGTWNCSAQNVAINTNGAIPDASAMLDVVNTGKGLLIPRVALASATTTVTIASPATSLLVYNTTAAGVAPNNVIPGYYYNSGTPASPVWVQLLNGGSAGPAWLTLGNTSTVDGINFIGTTDNVPFNIRVNNEKAGRIDNLFFNTFFGHKAGNATTGTQNTAIGSDALLTNITGTQNTAIGKGTLRSTTGDNNTAIGVDALYVNTTGVANTATGVGALPLNTDGDNNTATGVQALNGNTQGNNNTGLGYNAGLINTTGSNNTYLGYGTNGNANNLTKSTAIGYNSIVGASSAIVLGGTGADAMNVGIGLIAPTAKLHVAAPAADNVTAQIIDQLDDDQMALDVNAANTAANAVDISGTAVTTGRLLNIATNGNTWTGNGTTSGLVNIASTANTVGGGSDILLRVSRSGTNVNTNHTAYGVYSGVSNTWGAANGNNYALYGTASNSVNNLGACYGAYGTATGQGLHNYGIYGVGSGATENFGVVGQGTTCGVFGSTATGVITAFGQAGVYGTTDISGAYGVYGESTTTGATGIGGFFTSTGATSNYAIIVPFGGGNVGFGTSTPGFPLEVSGGVATASTNMRWFTNATDNVTPATNNQTPTVAIKANNAVWATGGFYASSDRRAKENIASRNSTDALALINKLHPVKYNWIDRSKSNHSFEDGFIAQEVEQVLPEVINTNAEVIPTIMELVEKTIFKNNILVFNLKKSDNVKEGDVLKVITEDGKEYKWAVASVNKNAVTLNVDENVQPTSKIFVYGQEIKDFKSVDYDRIFTIGISAIQELSRQHDAQRKEIENLKAEYNSRIQKLEEILGLPADPAPPERFAKARVSTKAGAKAAR